ncbi:MAG: pantetheine-phosphate adenylyltransferase [Anaerolineae bacterium]|jgi:pantetheine-phosphate adenylyltransferase|nr:pantetheine-phosphate adenylyltransferase [Anaerolineae bacterium]
MTTAVYPGTFDPIHNGHIDIVRRAVKIFDELIVAVYDRPLKSLFFDTRERSRLVEKALADTPRVRLVSYNTLTVELARQLGTPVIVRGLRVFSDFELEFRMALTNKRLAPDIDVVCLITSEEHTFLSSSTVKEVASLGGDVSGMVPAFVARALKERFAALGEDGPNSVPVISLRD